MVVNTREAQVLEWQDPQPGHGVIDAQPAALKVSQQLTKTGLVDVPPPKSEPILVC